MNALALYLPLPLRERDQGRGVARLGELLLFALTRSGLQRIGFERGFALRRLTFLCFAKEEVSKRKATLYGGATHCPAMLGTRGAAELARMKTLTQTVLAQKTPSPLRFSAPPKGPDVTSPIKSQSTAALCTAQAKQAPAVAVDSSVAGDVLLGPVEGAEKRRLKGGCARGLSERASSCERVPQRPFELSIAGQCEAPPDSGRLSFAYFFFGEAKKSKSPQGETTLKANALPADRASATSNSNQGQIQ